MANNKEIQDRINSIRDTRKITNAMYLISSSKLKKARKEQEKASDYFKMIRVTIQDILLHMPDMEHPYLVTKAPDPEKVKRAYIVVTADKGLAGAYNQNVIKIAEEKIEKHPDSKIYVVGQIGRHYFSKKKYPNYDPEFLYSAQNPNLQRARNMTVDMIDHVKVHDFDEVYIIYTRMKNALQSEAVMMQIFPLSRERFVNNVYKGVDVAIEKDNGKRESFFPDAKSVFNQVAPIAMQGIIYSALVESYCAELNDRMSAMDSASKNADDMIADLSLAYNRSRQGSITQEITEVIAGSKAQKKKKIS